VAAAPFRETLASAWACGGAVAATLFAGLAVLTLAMLVVVLLAWWVMVWAASVTWAADVQQGRKRPSLLRQ